MKVRILSGNQAGQVVDMPEIEAQTAIGTGFGESAEPKPEPEKAEKKEPERKEGPESITSRDSHTLRKK